MKKKHWTTLGLALGVLVLGILVGLMTVGTVAADPTPGVKIQLPRIDVGDVLGTGPWETWIQVQNVSIDDTDTGAIFLGWGDYSGLCPTNDPGVIVHYCQLIRGNAIWTLRTQIASDTKSAIIYTVREDVFMQACSDAELTEHNTDMWREWLKEWEFGTGMDITKDPAVPMTWGPAQGEEVAVTATRYGPNDYGTFVSSTYTGISREMEGDDSAPYEYYAPYVMKGYNGLDTELTIQNSGEVCTSVWIDYMEQGSCAIVYKHHVEQLAPGEAIRLKVPCYTGQIPCGWLGSAHISAEQPLGIIVDETSFDVPCMGVDRGTLLTHRARPKEEFRDGELIEDYKVYADLIFREWSGWESSIQVQNLSRVGLHTFVTVDFMDNSGDEILFLADWVCPTGSTTFYLPIVTDLLPGYVGAAEIQSHGQIDYPGGKTDAQPIFAVVDLKKPDNPLTPEMDAQGGSYNAHPESQKEWVSQIALPFMAKVADSTHPWTSMIAIRNNSNCNKIKPMIHFKDETGTIVCEIPSFWIRPKQVKMFDLNNIGCLYPGYIGAAKVYIEEFEQLCDINGDGIVDQEPLMPSVIVVERGILGLPYGGGGVTTLADTWGDITSIYEGIPYATSIPPCFGDVKGTVQSELGYDSSDRTSNPFPLFEAELYTVDRIVEGPFTADGHAYVDVDCGETSAVVLAGARVELYVLTCQEEFDSDDPLKNGCDAPDVDPDDWAWLEEDDTTTSSAGLYVFEDALELEEGDDPEDDPLTVADESCLPANGCYEEGDEYAYQLKIFVEEPGNTVSYVSDSFARLVDTDTCDVTRDFTIQTTSWGTDLDLDTGEWCETEISGTCFEDELQATTDSTGWYQISHDEEGKPILEEGIHRLKAYKDGFAACTKDDVAIPCNGQVYWNPELRCADIDFSVFVTQEDGSNPVQGADVHVDFGLSDHACVDDNDLDGATDHTGWYTFTDALQLQAGEAVTVTITKDGYDTKVVTSTATLTATLFYTCPGTATYTTTLCGYFTLYGKVEDGGANPYIGYTVKAEGKDTGAVVTPNQPDGDVTDSHGNYALGVSVKDCSDESGYYLRVYTSSGVLVHEKAVVTCSSTDCGDLKPKDITF